MSTTSVIPVASQRIEQRLCLLLLLCLIPLCWGCGNPAARQELGDAGTITDNTSTTQPDLGWGDNFTARERNAGQDSGTSGTTDAPWVESSVDTHEGGSEHWAEPHSNPDSTPEKIASEPVPEKDTTETRPERPPSSQWKEDPNAWYLVQKVFDGAFFIGNITTSETKARILGYPFAKDALTSGKYRLFMMVDWHVDVLKRTQDIRKALIAFRFIVGLPGRPKPVKFSIWKGNAHSTQFFDLFQSISDGDAKHITASVYNKTSSTPKRLKLAPFGGAGQYPRDRATGINVFDITDVVKANLHYLHLYAMGPYPKHLMGVSSTSNTFVFYMRDATIFLARKGTATPVSRPVKYGECYVGCGKTLTIGGKPHTCVNFQVRNVTDPIKPNHPHLIPPRPKNERNIGSRWISQDDYMRMVGSQYRMSSSFCIRRLCGDGTSIVKDLHASWTPPDRWESASAMSQVKEVHDRVDNNCDEKIDEGFTGVTRKVPVHPLSISAVPYRQDTVTINGGMEFSNYYIQRGKKGADAILRWHFPSQRNILIHYTNYTTKQTVSKKYPNRGSHTLKNLQITQNGNIVLLDEGEIMTQNFRFRVLIR